MRLTFRCGFFSTVFDDIKLIAALAVRRDATVAHLNEVTRI